MRHWFLVLMIALLPLRGWVGDAMAMDQVATPSHHSVTLIGHGDAGAADHGGGHASQHSASQGDHEGAAGEHSHDACDVCNVPALSLETPLAAAQRAAHRLQAWPVERFASSEARRGSKPPIS